MSFNKIKISFLLILVGLLTLFGFKKNESRIIESSDINFIEPNFKFSSIDSVNKLLKQTNFFSNEIIANLKVGETFENSKIKILFKGIEQKEEKNFKSIVANFNIENSMGVIENLSPELRIYNQPNIVTSEADIKTTMMSDKFIVINVVQNQDYFNVRYQVKPFMLWIWLSVLLISFGGLLSLFKKNYE